MTRIKLDELKDNPWRDFKVDPIDTAHVASMQEGMDQYGLLPGVWVRKVEADYQIAAGHHRVRAAKAAGIEEAELVVQDYDEAEMVCLYSLENATQRHGQNGARIGSVAAACEFLAGVLLGPCPSEHSLFFASKHAREQAHKALLSDTGLGERAIHYFLHVYGKVPITTRMVKEELATLKASKHYARIIERVQKKIAAEAARIEADEKASAEAKEKARAEKEAAEQAALKAAARDKTFDLNGVREHLKVPDHVQTFFNLVTRKTMVVLLPVDMQAPLAAYLVETAAAEGVKFTSSYIHKNGFTMAMEVVERARTAARAEAINEARNANLDEELKRCVHYFGQNARGLKGYIEAIQKLNSVEGLVLDAIQPRELRHMLDFLDMVEKSLAVARSIGFKFGEEREDDNVLDLPAERRLRRKALEHRANGEATA